MENGVVTFFMPGAKTDMVDITASKGMTNVSCKFTVNYSSLPDDYRVMAEGKKTTVVANPGVWYFLADNLNSSYVLSGKPYYGGGAMTATFTTFKDMPSKRFYFRYQPDMEVGAKYTAKFTVTINVDGALSYGAGQNLASKNLKANVPQEIVYEGTVDASDPFHMSMKSVTIANYSNVTFKVENIVIY